VRYHLFALAAGGGAVYLLEDVLARLERGGGQAVGRRITWLATALFAMLVGANNAFQSVDASYAAAALVLIGTGLFWSARRQWFAPASTSGPRRARASILLLQAGALLLAVLWVVQRAFVTFTPDRKDATELFATFAGAGLLAMAIVQGLRTLVPLRGVFHRLALERWIDDSTSAAPPSAGGTRTGPSAKRILGSITGLARGPVAGDRYALLDLPIEQLCGQIAAGADRLLDEPSTETLTSTPPAATAAAGPTVAAVLTALAAGSKDIDRYLELARKVIAATNQPPLLEPPPESREYVRLRANLSQRIQRNIDGLQIATTFWWRRTLRGLAFTICGVLGLSAFAGDPTFATVCAVVGGFVATASRDLVAVVEKARR
jgi:hypothetical protein